MSNVITTQLRDPAIPDEMKVERFANSQKIESNKIGQKWLAFASIFFIAAPMTTMVGGLGFIVITAIHTPLVLVIFASSFPAMIFGTLVSALCADAADAIPDWSLRRRTLKWLLQQGHVLNEDEVEKLMTVDKVVLQDAPTGLKFKVERKILESESVVITYNVVKKPKTKAIPVEGKRTFLQSFTPSSQELVDSIQGRGKQLLTLPLSVEDQHAVERVLSDVEELNKLGSVTQGSEPTKLQMRTLKTLNKEMKSLAVNVNNSMVKQLKIHASYVEERNRTRSELSLDPRTRKVTL